MEEQNLETVQTVETKQEATPAERDYGSEVRELFTQRPELRGEQLPEEVLQACVEGKPLKAAYDEFARRQRAEAAALRKENRILRENAKTAARTPVRGVTRGGSVHAQPEDPFLRGFNSQW